MADFIIEFEALAMKADIDKLYVIFLLKKNVVVATTYHNNKWSHKWVNLKSRYNVGSSQENSTRSLC